MHWLGGFCRLFIIVGFLPSFWLQSCPVTTLFLEIIQLLPLLLGRFSCWAIAQTGFVMLVWLNGNAGFEIKTCLILIVCVEILEHSRSIFENLFRLKESVQFHNGVLWRVGCMDDVLLETHTKVSAYGARGGLA